MNDLNQTVTITLHHVHDIDLFYDTFKRYPDIKFIISSPDPRLTQLQGSYRSIIEILLDYYYWNDPDVLSNHPEITPELLQLFYDER